VSRKLIRSLAFLEPLLLIPYTSNKKPANPESASIWSGLLGDSGTRPEQTRNRNAPKINATTASGFLYVGIATATTPVYFAENLIMFVLEVNSKNGKH
jgi:hypothetical protein